MKYIIFQDFSAQPVPFLFPAKVAHADMRDQLPYSKVISAGYVRLDNGKFTCSGGDADLGISSRKEDADIITRFFQ
jgi:hypothetical protein